LKAAVLHKPLDLTVEEIQNPTIAEDEVLVMVKATGICGTDIHVYRGVFPNMRFPVVPGHEYAGQVAEVGSAVEQVREGDRVIGEGSWGCGKCHFCKGGQPNSCADLRRLGRTVDGAFAEYVKVPAKSTHVLHENINYEEAQSIMTLACIMHAMKRIKMEIGDTVAILGPGHVGLLFLQALRGIADRTFVLGTRDDMSRLKLAANLGASATIDVTSVDPIERIRELTNGKGVDVAIEASGSPIAINHAVKMVKSAGQVLLFGTAEKPVEGFDAIRVQNEELTIVGSRAGLGGYDAAISLLASRRVSVADLITNKFTLQDIGRAYETVDKRTEDYVRVIVTP